MQPDDGLFMLHLKTLRQIAAQEGVEIPEGATQFQIVVAIRRHRDPLPPLRPEERAPRPREDAPIEKLLKLRTWEEGFFERRKRALDETRARILRPLRNGSGTVPEP